MGAVLFHADGRTDGRTDGHDETNSRFSQFCEIAWKWIFVTVKADKLMFYNYLEKLTQCCGQHWVSCFNSTHAPLVANRCHEMHSVSLVGIYARATQRSRRGFEAYKLPFTWYTYNEDVFICHLEAVLFRNAQYFLPPIHFYSNLEWTAPTETSKYVYSHFLNCKKRLLQHGRAVEIPNI